MPTLEALRLEYRLGIKHNSQIYRLPHSQMSWEEQDGEVAMRITITVPDVHLDVDGTDTWIGDLLAPGTECYILAGDVEGLIECGRGLVVRFDPTGEETITVTLLDRTYQMCKSKFDLRYPADTTPSAMIKDLAARAKLDVIGTIPPTLDQIKLPKQTFRAEDGATIVKKILQATLAHGGGHWVVRGSMGGLQVVEYGSNTDVYWLERAASTSRAQIVQSIEDLITRVLVMADGPVGNNTGEGGTWSDEDRNKLLFGESTLSGGDGGGDSGGGGGDTPSPPASADDKPKLTQVASADGATSYGLITEMIVLQQQVQPGQDDLQKIAQATLAISGFPVYERTFTAMDVPYLRKGDKVQVTDRLVSGDFYVTSISHDSDGGEMTLKLTSLEELRRAADAAALQEQVDKILNPPTAPAPVGGGALTPELLGLSGGNAGAAPTAPNTNSQVIIQTRDWSCSATSLANLLTMLGHPATEDEMISRIGGGINADQGLLDRSGTQLRRILGEEGFESQYFDQISYQDALNLADGRPFIMSGQAWYHWTAVRGRSGDQLRLANPAPNWKGIGQEMTEAEFNAMGPFNAIIPKATPTRSTAAISTEGLA